MFSDTKVCDLGLDQWLLDNCATMKLVIATKIQALAIPHILNGKDVIARARTGSGKTAAFALPILHHLSQDPYGIFCLIITPTRELACQIGDQFIALSANTGFTIAVVYGGSGYITNTGAIENRPHILISTPGRLADLIQSGMEFDVSELKYLVIDEADQLLCNPHFSPALSTIFETLPDCNHRQTLLFSATLDKSMHKIFQLLLPQLKESTNKLIFLETSLYNLDTVENTTQTYLFIPEMSKEAYLLSILKLCNICKKHSSIIIFISSKEYCMIIARLLKKFHLRVSELHANMKQKKRLSSLLDFRNGRSKILIATDVASRGLDITQVQLVINFDIPRNAYEYVHRIGRCGRIDRRGTSITFVSQYDVQLLKKIEYDIKLKMIDFIGCPLSEIESEDDQQTTKQILDEYVLRKMEQILIIRAGIINGIETKYLLNSNNFNRKHQTLRWNGKFTDPRILGKVNLKEIKHKNIRIEKKHELLFNDYNNAMISSDDDDEKQEIERKEKEEKFFKTLKYKEKKKKKNKNENKVEMEVLMDDELNDDANEKDDDDENEVGQDFHSIPGWQAFRYGKQATRMKNLERIERAKAFQAKKRKMAVKRSRRYGQQQSMNILSIGNTAILKRKIWKRRREPINPRMKLYKKMHNR